MIKSEKDHLRYIMALELDPKFNSKRYRRGKDSLNVRYGRYKYNAKRTKIDFDLTKEQFNTITEKTCYYCGEFDKGKQHCGIDRISSKKGYVKGNMRPCCWMCNAAKREHSDIAYIKHCMKVAKQYRKRIRSRN